jgi:phosphoribosyl 1,2-cyclic phosphodiesterase/GAF domain-containing protein
MKVRFWGTRGSIAKPGLKTVRFGGNTSCVQVESDAGTLLVLDCGTGAHELGQWLLRHRKPPLRGHFLISHTHWDHIQGIPFFAPLFRAGNHWEFYAAQGFGESLRETLAGQMEFTYFPVTMDAMAAAVRYHHLVEGTFRIDDVIVRTRYLNHPALTLGFRIEVDGAVLVYACDHEPHARELAAGGSVFGGQDLDHAEFLRGADLVIHDAQYTAAEYPDKVGWGHSTWEYVVDLCRSVDVKCVAMTHHDPLRDDDTIDGMLQDMRARLEGDGSPLKVLAAAEGEVLELRGPLSGNKASVEAGPSALVANEIGTPQLVVLAVGDDAVAGLITEAIRADGTRVMRVHDAQTLLQRCLHERPALILVDKQLPDMDGPSLCRTIRAAADEYARQVPVIVVAMDGVADDDEDAGVTDWLLVPFSNEYVRTRVRAWLLRSTCRWMLPPTPPDESQRLAALHGLGILDTPPEERFDRLTRLASAVLGVPVALVSLVDRDRQWFKSFVGLDVNETPREVSFCAHAIHGRDILLVPDALQDPRFADNPVVTSGPRVRFYAGRPLWLPSGHCVGTLCIGDTHPRDLTPEQMQLLDDLGALVEREITSTDALSAN